MPSGYSKPVLDIPVARAKIFQSRVAKGNDSECWPYTFAVNPAGYGVFSVGRRQMAASRVAYFLFYGIDPGSSNVLHKCDNPPCCNPAHLFLGSQSDNVMDCHKKGRFAYGEKHGTAVLNDALVRAIRQKASAGIIHRVLADEYGVTRQEITKIVNRQKWRHVE